MPVITIDGKKIEAAEGEKLLFAALDNGIYIPNLCGYRGRVEPATACRLCYVEIEGRPGPVISCAETVQEGMVVRTNTEATLKLSGAAFELIMSTHPVVCGVCPANRRCALQDIARTLKFKLKQKRFPNILTDYPEDESHPDFNFDANRCIHCGKCVYACNEEVKAMAIDFNNRGLRTKVGVFEEGKIIDSPCISCYRCVEVCPVHAFYYKRDAVVKK